MKCKHCLTTEENEIGEMIAFCELKDRFMNVTQGECFGNCDAEDGKQVGRKLTDTESIGMLFDDPSDIPEGFIEHIKQKAVNRNE